MGDKRKMNKEELKDEMKNRISLALKDPILQQGFEIICKENAELKNLMKSEHEIEARKNNRLISQLTTAKELLKKWVELFKPKGGNIPPTPIQVDTEQFLKDSKVEK